MMIKKSKASPVSAIRHASRRHRSLARYVGTDLDGREFVPGLDATLASTPHEEWLGASGGFVNPFRAAR